ncbi:MAG: hypothetical protein RLZZ324_233 [Candidatus Parcubacteria bacterium]|jgi:prepilin-type N-terminal cleavage/methylation domain-containing protein
MTGVDMTEVKREKGKQGERDVVFAAEGSVSRGRHGAGQKGFTLMELLVVLGIMSMVVTAASDIFLLTSRSQRKIFGLERTQADARFTMEAMAREIRTGQIDYAYYAARTPALATPDTELALIDSTGAPLRFAMSDATTAANCYDAASTPCLLVTTGGAVTPSPITPQGVAVINVKFYVTPTADPDVFVPATGTYSGSSQPKVTIVMVLQSTAERSSEQSTVSLQTTVSSRRYRR